ncbi:MAG: hypothetical protein AB1750_16500 [Chloroflexota bacterium]
MPLFSPVEQFAKLLPPRSSPMLHTSFATTTRGQSLDEINRVARENEDA